MFLRHLSFDRLQRHCWSSPSSWWDCSVYRQLSVAALPTVEFPTIQVVTSWPGASPDVMQSVDFGAARAFSRPHLRPDLDEFVELVRHEARSRCNSSCRRASPRRRSTCRPRSTAATGWLPVNDLPFPPIYHQVNPADMPVLVIALTSDTMPLYAVTEYAATALIPRLAEVDGVGEVSPRAPKRAPCGCRSIHAASPGSDCRWRTFAEPSKATTVDQPKGQIDGPRQSFEVGANDQLFAMRKDYRDAIDRLSETAHRSSSAISARPSTDLKTKSWRPGTTASRR